MDLNKMFKENDEPLTEYEQYLMSKYDVELVFPGGIEVVQKKKAEVLAESILLAMALNVNKLHNKIQTGRTGKHLFELKKIV